MRTNSAHLLTSILALASIVSLGTGFLLVGPFASMTDSSLYQRESQTLLIIGAYFAVLSALVVIKNALDTKKQ